MSAESSSTSPLQRVNVRKLVKDYITDHFLRANINLRSSVCGILIGDAGDTITVSNSFPVENMKQLRDAKNLRDKYFPKEEIELYRGSFTHSDRSNSHILGYYCCGSNLALSVHQKIIAQMRRDNGEAHIVLLQKDIGSQLNVYQLLNNKFQQTVEDLQETVVVIGTEEYKVDWPANEIFVRMSLATDPNSPVLNAERFCSRIGKYSKAFARQIPFDTLKKPAPPSLWRKMQKMYESFMTSGQYHFAIPIRGEIQNAVTTSEALRSEDKIDLAYDLIQNKLKAYPLNYMLNQEFGHILRTLLPDSAVIMAYIQYNMAFETAPDHAKENLIRYIDETSAAVDKQIDAKFLEIQKLMKKYNQIPRSNPYLNSALRELYYVQIYETLKIEGNKLSPDEMKQLIEGKRIKGQAMKDHREVFGVRNAMSILEDKGKFKLGGITLEDLLEMHHKILEHSDGEYAGKLRNCGVAIGNLNTPPSNDVPKLVNEMLQFCNSMCDDLHPIDLAAFTHYFALAIHGFADGNGRTSRMLQNVILSRYGFPPITIKVDEKQQYYFRLRSSHSAYAGDCRIFLDYIASEMEKTISGLIEIANSETNYSTTHQIIFEGKV